MIKGQKNQPQTSVHTSQGPILCKGSDCGTKFIPNRKKQVFCSAKCRLRYFSVARALGIELLEKSRLSQSWRALVDLLLKETIDQTENLKRANKVERLRETLDREN